MARAGASQSRGAGGEHLRSLGEVQGFQRHVVAWGKPGGSESSHAGLGKLGQVSVALLAPWSLGGFVCKMGTKAASSLWGWL